MPSEGIVRLVGSGNHDQANFRHREQFVHAPHDANIGIFLGCLGTAALHNDGKVQSCHSTNHRVVKSSASETESDKPDFNLVHPSFPTILPNNYQLSPT